MLQFVRLSIFLLFPVSPVLGQDALPKTHSPETPGQSSAPLSEAEFAANVRDAIHQLDASRLAQRQSAEKKIVEFGPRVLPFLDIELATLSAEARMRISRIRRQLEKQKTIEQLSRTSIHLGKARTLGEALDTISKSSGTKLITKEKRDQPINISLTSGLRFWEALDVVLDAVDLDVNFYGGDGDSLELVRRAKGRPSRIDTGTYTGVYRLEATAVSARRVLNRPKLNSMSVDLEIAWEPHLTPIGLTIPMRSIQARLADDTPIAAQQIDAEQNISANSDLAFSETSIPLQLPVGPSRKIASLTGVLTGLLPGPKEKFSFPLSSQKDVQEKQIGEVSVKVLSVSQDDDLTGVRILLVLKNPSNALESHNQWIIENEAYVTGKNGSRHEQFGYEVFRQTASEFGVEYRFGIGENLEDYQFHYVTPTAIVSNEVSFTIKDILLP